MGDKVGAEDIADVDGFKASTQGRRTLRLRQVADAASRTPPVMLVKR